MGVFTIFAGIPRRSDGVIVAPVFLVQDILDPVLLESDAVPPDMNVKQNLYCVDKGLVHEIHCESSYNGSPEEEQEFAYHSVE